MSPRIRDERGAVTAIVAVLFSGGVVLGMLALTLDLGRVAWERRQLQNGADAAARGLSIYCAADLTKCNPTTAAGLLTPLINSNAADGKAAFDPARGSNGLCGRNVGGRLPACSSASTDASITDLKECPALPSWLRGAGSTIPYVEAYTMTRATDGAADSTILPFEFANAMGGEKGTTVRACARSSWGAPVNYEDSVPITFSHCEWKFYMNSGAGWVTNQPTNSWPGYGGSGRPPWPAANQEVTIFLHNTNEAVGHKCAVNGKDTGGGFGYVIPDGSGSCLAHVSSNHWSRIDTGNSATTDCRTKIASLRGTVVTIPVFSCLISSGYPPTGSPAGYADCTGNSAGGSNSYYYIAGWAKFYLSGYKIGGSDQQPSLRSGSVPCSGSSRCISGWFLKGELTSNAIAPPDPASDYGTYAILNAG